MTYGEFNAILNFSWFTSPLALIYAYIFHAKEDPPIAAVYFGQTTILGKWIRFIFDHQDL